MNNYEKIKSMSIEEMAEYFAYGRKPKACGFCIAGNGGNCLIQVSCHSAIQQWLQAESEE